MKRIENVYPVYIFGREFFVTFDHFTNLGAAVYNVEFIAIGAASHLVKYKGVIAANREDAAKKVFSDYNKVEK